MGLQPNVVTFSALINTCARVGEADKALEYYREMLEKWSVNPNVTAFNVVIHACAKGRKGREAVGVYEEMKGRGVEPTRSTYNSLLNACSKMSGVEGEKGVREGEWGGKKGREIFEEMKESGVGEDTVTMNSLVNLCRGEGDLEGAIKYYEEMKERFVRKGKEKERKKSLKNWRTNPKTNF